MHSSSVVQRVYIYINVREICFDCSDCCFLVQFQVLTDSQPLTPISSSTPDHHDARTPQSVRSLDSEPMIPPSVPPTPIQGPQKPGRKRKVDRNSVRQTHSASTSGGGGGENNMTTTGSSGMHSHNSSNQQHSSLSSPCAKRQIIVQNEVMDGTPGNSSSSSSHGGHNGSLTAPVTPGSVGHDSGSSPHHSEPDNSGDSARWRKINHQPHTWESTVYTYLYTSIHAKLYKYLFINM